jgi:hypothetical protein
MFRFAALTVAVLFLIGTSSANEGVLGAEANPTGDPIGGGEAYSRILTGGDYTVATVDELLQALESAQSGEVVYLAPDAEIDIGDRTDLIVPEGVTLAGNRGQAGAPGPLIFGSELPPQSQMFLARSETRITGLRIRGRDPDFAEIDYDERERSWSRAIMAVGEGVEIDNCEISNVHHSGVNVQAADVHVHHNHIHNVHAYPVVIGDRAGPPTLIEANRIYWIWHAIAGTGAPGTGYEARYNEIIGGEIPESWGRRYHCFDMHAFRPLQNAGHGLIAGDTLLIHHNTVRNMGGALGARIRGIPREICEIHHNWFAAEDVEQAIEQVEPHCNLWAYQNAHGPDRSVVAVGDETTARVTFRSPPPPTANLPVISGALALDFDVALLEGVQLRSVVVQLGEATLYDATAAPEAEEVTIDTTTLENGIHSFTVTVTDDRGVVSRYPRYFEVAN